MDLHHVPSTPEWRPQSSLSEGVQSAATSSLLRHQQSSPYDDRSSISSSENHIVSNAAVVEAGRDISPFETVTCERLIQRIGSFATPQSSTTLSHEARQSDSLAIALGDAATTIRYNAKWFAPESLADLLLVALDAASASSISLDLAGGLALIDAVAIYSSIPLPSLPQVTKFLARTYYNATRANKTRKLATSVWTTMQQIMETHLGDQLISELLQIVRDIDQSSLDSRTGYARIAGALMVTSDKLLAAETEGGGVLLPLVAELLEVLNIAATKGDEHARGLVVDVVITLLTSDEAIEAVTTEGGWKSLLAVVKVCVDLEPAAPKCRALVDNTVAQIGHFDSTEHAILASLCVVTGRPLQPTLKDALLQPWTSLTPAKRWSDDFESQLQHLAASSEHIIELQNFLQRAATVSTNSPDQFPPVRYAKSVQTCIILDKNSTESSAILGIALVNIFLQAAKTQASDHDLKQIFTTLCVVARQNVEVTTFLLGIRTDVGGAAYIQLRDSVRTISDDLRSLLQTTLVDLLKNCGNWSVYEVVIRELPTLLGNHAMFNDRGNIVLALHDIIRAALESGSYQDPPSHTGLTKSHVAARLVEALTALLSYAHLFTKADILQMYSTILKTARSRDYVVSIPCIHAITIMCYEYPALTGRFMDDIIDQMARLVTQRLLAIHVLLFLAGLSRLPDVFRPSFQTADYKKIFGVCGSYLQSIRGSNARSERQPTPSDDQSSRASTMENPTEALLTHVYALAHHVIAFWYIAISKEHRKALKEYISSCLTYIKDGEEVIEDQGLVTIDLMDRIDSDGACEEEDQDRGFAFDDTAGRITTSHRLRGLLLITTETALRTAETIVTVRRSTGTSRRIVGRNRNSMDAIVTLENRDKDIIDIFSNDTGGRTYGRIIVPSASTLLGSSKLITLPEDDDAVNRAIQSIDRTPGLDSHKAGVIYIGEGQKNEEEILQNVQGSPDYVTFIENLGTLRPLKNASFNTQGLDRADDADGPHAVVWNNEVTELVFHVTTLMPNNPDANLNTANKKRHIGNDFVSIVFNNSGGEFDFNTFPSQFNAVYIVITPSARTSFLQTRLRQSYDEKAFYRVQVLTRAGYPVISSAATEKIVSSDSLAGYVRNLALNDCVFSVMWNSQEMESGEYPSSWRSRLEQIRRMGMRFG